MYTGFKPNTSITKSITPGLGETHLESLQREVDSYTRKLEQEKKKYFSIEDTHKLVSEEYMKEKAKLDELKKESSKAQSVQIQAKIRNLEAGLEKAVSVFDETVAQNTRLKGEIDMLRREKKNYIESQVILDEQIKVHEEQIAKKMQEIEGKKEKVEELKKQMASIKERNEQEQTQYLQQFDSLEKQYLKQKKQREQTRFEKGTKPEPIDTQPLLKHRLKQLIKSNKAKLKMIDQYKKHMRQIQEAFTEIGERSGITDLTEITNTFIKAEQQNYSLYNYMDSLSRNIDSLEKANAELQLSIDKKSQAEAERQRSSQTLPEEERKRKQLEQYLKRKEEATQQLTHLIEAIKPTLGAALIELASSPLCDDPAKASQYALGMNITHRSIEGYLSDLQKFVGTLLLMRQSVKPQLVSSVKDSATIYSKQVPAIDEVGGRDKNGELREDQRLMDESKFREYAVEYWDKRKNKANTNSIRD